MDNRCIEAGTLEGGGYEKMFEQSRRVYSTEGAAPTTHTKPGGNQETKILEPVLVGGVGKMKSNGGTQYYQQDRVYDSDSVAMAHCSTIPGGSYKYKIINGKKFRIRKLTPVECGRLMAVKDEDIARIGKRQSQSLKYHLFGDSIVATCLMAIFGVMLDVDYNAKIDEVARCVSAEQKIGGGGVHDSTHKERNEGGL